MSFTEDFSILVDQAQDKWLALNQQNMCCPAYKARKVGILNFEIYI